MNDTDVIVTDSDRRRLGSAIEEAQRRERLDYYHYALEQGLEQAHVVTAEQVPDDVVTMNSLVRIHDFKLGNDQTIRLVYPAELEDGVEGLSVASPLGTALLGRRVGQEISCWEPTGQRRVRIVEVIFQPERDGALHL
ncbi:MAG TPA: GreA/GreB family elongation factor [Pirellulales bacterium]|nr:GreA/GreB family elongation factor [Pirellulales bacterium]